MHILSNIKITGPDAFQFLQGQVSNDLRRLDNEAEILAAWCNPKGRVIWFGTLRRGDDGFSLSAPAEIAEDVIKRLTMFRFRSKLEFERVDTGETMDPSIAIERGYPFIGKQQSGQFTPHMLNLDLLDAISFDKGCYPGQEIVARTHYKGATKRRALRFSCNKTVDVGDKVSLDGRDIGEVLNVAGNHLLAVVPVDKADEALTIGGTPLQREQLPYL
jgi:folate-binding protein YgfZ